MQDQSNSPYPNTPICAITVPVRPERVCVFDCGTVIDINEISFITPVVGINGLYKVGLKGRDSLMVRDPAYLRQGEKPRSMSKSREELIKHWKAWVS